MAKRSGRRCGDKAIVVSVGYLASLVGELPLPVVTGERKRVGSRRLGGLNTCNANADGELPVGQDPDEVRHLHTVKVLKLRLNGIQAAEV